jgi:hypothetical protein
MPACRAIDSVTVKQAPAGAADVDPSVDTLIGRHHADATELNRPSNSRMPGVVALSTYWHAWAHAKTPRPVSGAAALID